MEVDPELGFHEYSLRLDRLPTLPAVPGRPGLSTSTWKLGIGLPCSDKCSMLLDDILPMLFRLVTLGLEGMRIRVGSLLAGAANPS